MPLLSTLGAASAQAFGAGARQTAVNYVEDVFSTYLYTATQTSFSINNGIDLSGKGGLVWFKDRSGNRSHALFDTVRGVSSYLRSNTTGAAATNTNALTSFNSNGFTLGTDSDGVNTNYPAGNNFVSWTFRKQPKFFDIVTWTGDGTNNRSILHNLGSNPAIVIIKATSTTSNWAVAKSPFAYYTGYSYTGMYLNTTAAVGTTTVNGLGVASTSSTNFVVQASTPDLEFFPNTNGVTYVAYLFASNAGGFGADGSQNVISCGSYTGNGSATGPSINLGYEPQWLLVKRASGGTGSWEMIDNMRGFVVNGSDSVLYANLSNAEAQSVRVSPLSTGFQINTASTGLNNSGDTYIYMAIRRGPMRTPTSGTSVFYALNRTGTGGSATLTGASFAPDVYISKATNQATYNPIWYDKLRSYYYLLSSTSGNEGGPGGLTSYNNNGVSVSGGSAYGLDGSGDSIINYMFSRAPGFMDEVCYTGTGAFNSINHNLGVVPELIIAKSRSNSEVWYVDRPNNDGKTGVLNNTAAWFANWPSGQPTATSTQFRKTIDTNTYTYVAYLFASCPGVSKIGTYTGTGSTQTINCGFTGGARFVLIKRLDGIGNWWIWDTARGMVSGTDPRFPLNIADVQTNTNWVYTTTGGFQVVTADSTVNASGGSYIYLAIA